MNNEKREQQMMDAADAYVEESEEIYNIVEAITDFCAGWRAADNSRWIPVEKELPEPHFADTSSYWVLVYTTKWGIFIDSYNHKHGEWCNTQKSVTHWMEIQPPRKEDKE